MKKYCYKVSFLKHFCLFLICFSFFYSSFAQPSVDIGVFNAGGNQVEFKTNSLPAGVYGYSLFVNDEKVDSKQMVIGN